MPSLRALLLLAALPLSTSAAATSTDAPAEVALRGKVTALEEQLNNSLANYTQLSAENARLRADVERGRNELAELSAQLRAALEQARQAQDALAQATNDLAAQKQARIRAEQFAEAARAQISAVIDRGASTPSSGPSNTGGSAPGTNSPAALPATDSKLRQAKSPPADSLPGSDMRSGANARPKGTSPAPSAPPASPNTTPPTKSAGANTKATPPTAKAAPTRPEQHVEPSTSPIEPAPKPDTPPTARGRVHVVKAGETLEKIAERYYGSASEWFRVFSANEAQFAGGKGLHAGMELSVPE